MRALLVIALLNLVALTVGQNDEGVVTREINVNGNEDNPDEGDDFRIRNDDEPTEVMNGKVGKGNKVSKDRAQKIMEALGWKAGNGSIRKRLNKS